MMLRQGNLDSPYHLRFISYLYRVPVISKPFLR